MSKYQVVITYKNGSTILIDVPENYYQNKYSKKPETKIHKIFMKEYNNFVSALNVSENIVKVGKYLSFSNATVSAKDVLGVDLKTTSELQQAKETAITVPGVHDKVYLDINETSLDVILKKLETTNLLENLDTFIKKINAMMARNNVEFTIKAGAKKKVSSKTVEKKKSPIIEPSMEETSEIIDVVSEPVILNDSEEVVSE